MKRLLLLPLLASLAASPAAAPAQSRPAAAQRPKPAAGAQGLRARPVEIAVHAPRPKDLPDDLAFYGPEDGRYEIGYLVRGTGFSRVVKDSLRVSSATAGGADVSKDAKGAPSWSLDHFPKVSDDGTAATFTLCVEPGRDRMKAAMPVVHGSIDVERASGKETKIATLSLAPGSSAVLGPVTVRDEEEGRTRGVRRRRRRRGCRRRSFRRAGRRHRLGREGRRLRGSGGSRSRPGARRVLRRRVRRRRERRRNRPPHRGRTRLPRLARARRGRQGTRARDEDDVRRPQRHLDLPRRRGLVREGEGGNLEGGAP